MTVPTPGETRIPSPTGGLLATPPPDVQSLLRCHGAWLPLYFDAQRAEAEQRSRQDWPCLWQLAPDQA